VLGPAQTLRKERYNGATMSFSFGFTCTESSTDESGLEQGDLAAAEGTESYISQLLTRKKLPPVPSRTDIYDKVGKFLKLLSGTLAELADHQGKEGAFIRHRVHQLVL
jgi:hypothetical protein